MIEIPFVRTELESEKNTKMGDNVFQKTEANKCHQHIQQQQQRNYSRHEFDKFWSQNFPAREKR